MQKEKFYDFNAIHELLGSVQQSLDDRGTINPKKALQSIKYARELFFKDPIARQFIDKNIARIVSIIVSQEVDGDNERIIRQSLKHTLKIIVYDLEAVNDKKRKYSEIVECTTLVALGNMLRKNSLYRNIDGSISKNPLPVGITSVRDNMIDIFRRINGYTQLSEYLKARACTSQFPSLDYVNTFLQAANESLLDATNDGKLIDEIVNAVQRHMLWLDIEDYTDHSTILHDSCMVLYEIQSKMCESHTFVITLLKSYPRVITDYFTFWRCIALKLVRSESLPLRQSGWQTVKQLVEESCNNCPPTRAYLVSGAGSDFVNGRYEFDSERILNNGYGNTNKSFEYQRQIPDDYPNVEVAGKILTMYCYEGGGWYICVLDDESPRSEFDIDYYCSEDDDKLPPLSNWDTCDAGELPLPTLAPVGMVCPEGKEFNTPEHQLAKWAIENKLVELALEDSTQSDIVDKSSELFSFLARMCDKFDWLYHNGSITVDTKFCLDLSHIRLIREACAKTTDVQVLEKLSAMMMYHLESSLPDQLKELVTPIRKTAAERRIQLNDPTMKELMIGGSFYADDNEECIYIPSDGNDFQRLGQNIRTNNHVKKLHFDGSVSTMFGNMELESRESFLSNLKNNSSISLLQLYECDVTESLGAGVLKSFGDRLSKLTELTISDCILGSGGAVVFALRKCRHLKKVSLVRNGVNNAILADIVTALKGQRELEDICLTDNIIEGVAGCNTLVHLLQDNTMSNLLTLTLDSNPIDDAGLLALAAGLFDNVRLKKLELLWVDITESVFLDAFSQVLCDTSCVNSTYLSNHTLEEVRINWQTYPFSTYLEMNAASDKSRVAIKKILRHHSNIDMMPFFEWELKVLPIAIRWFDKAIGFAATSQSISMEEEDDEDDSTPESREEVANIETEKLSAIYQFVTAMPMFFVPTVTTVLPLKRKQSTLT